MNKSFIYGGIGVLAVVVIAGAMFYSNKSEPGGPSGSSESSLKELIAKGGSQKCDFSHETNGITSSGTVYISSGKMRGDFTSNTSGKTIMSHMIVDNETAYVWSDMMAQGMKMSFAGMTSNSSSNSAFDADQKLNYDCDRWSADESKFAMPSGVTFMDLSAAIPTPSASTGGSVNAACTQCNFITDAAAKAQCRVALKCQ